MYVLPGANYVYILLNYSEFNTYPISHQLTCLMKPKFSF